MNEKNVKRRKTNTQFYIVFFVRTFVIPFYYGSGTVINYGSGSDFLTSYGSLSGSGFTKQKVTVPTDPVPVLQHCKRDRHFFLCVRNLCLGDIIYFSGLALHDLRQICLVNYT
jgi:hypothetical protein